MSDQTVRYSALQMCAIKIGRIGRRWAPARWFSSVPNPILAQALGHWATARSDIRDHLGTLFYEAVAARPRLIVELGTRGGGSTRALLAAAEVTGAHLLSVDIEDCGAIDLPERFRSRWTFIRADDIAFAKAPFEAFCAARGLPPVAEVIFIDTSHEEAHTRAELACWLPRLAAPGVMMFHDTNMGAGWYRCLNGRADPGGNRTRGVIGPIEELLGRRYDESTFFSDATAELAVSHVPWSAGFLVLRKLAAPSAPAP
jgi:predicted O-methyltransferase YrrM